MANIYDRKITVYRGHETQPDGTECNYAFATAWFCDDDPVCGEYLFCVDDDGKLIPTYPLGNAAEYDDFTEFVNWCSAKLGSPKIE